MKTDKEAAEDLTKDFLKNYPIPYDEQITIEYPVIYDGLIDMFLAACKHKEESLNKEILALKLRIDGLEEALLKHVELNEGNKNTHSPTNK